ncbi:MAG: hypothetical protein ACR2OH_09120 [Microthrixaceae bacterium]
MGMVPLRARRDVRAAFAGAALALVCTTLSGAAAQISPGDIGGSHSVVAGCDDDIGVTWAAGAAGPTFAGAATVGDSSWVVSALRLTGVDVACDGLTYELTLVDPADSVIASATGILSVTAGVADIPFASVDAGLVDRTVIAVHG